MAYIGCSAAWPKRRGTRPRRAAHERLTQAARRLRDGLLFGAVVPYDTPFSKEQLETELPFSQEELAAVGICVEW